MSELRNKLRSKALSSPAAKLFTIGDDQVEIRLPSFNARRRILNAAGIETSAKGTSSLGNNLALGPLVVFEFAYVPGTDERLFDEADREAFFSSSPSELVQELAKEAAAMIYLSGEAKKELGKDSARTPGDASSSTFVPKASEDAPIPTSSASD